MSNNNNPYLAHLSNNNNNKNYNNSSSHRIHLDVKSKAKDPNKISFNSLKAKSVFSLNKSFHPYTNTSNESFNSERKVLKNNKFIYGNYEHYYRYRNKSSIPIDPRIELFEEEWFKDKICLDVGCNSGFLTTSIAMLFEPKLIEGVDIDPHLIKKAQNYLIFRNSLIKYNEKEEESKEQEEKKKEIEEDLKEKKNEQIKNNKVEKEKDNLFFDYYPISCPLTIGSIPILLNNQQDLQKIFNSNNKIYNETEISNSKIDIDKDLGESALKNNTNVENKNSHNLKIDKNSSNLLSDNISFPNNIYFRASDWVNEPIIEDQKNSYDIIMRLSITKWIHLNWADYGIKRFFNKVYELLNDNGIFILEPQPFSGYSRKAKNNKV
ncbi:Bicoid-interacting protein 3-domain-containing protein [Neocallimastix sp. 'constans']